MNFFSGKFGIIARLTLIELRGLTKNKIFVFWVMVFPVFLYVVLTGAGGLRSTPVVDVQIVSKAPDAQAVQELEDAFDAIRTIAQFHLVQFPEADAFDLRLTLPFCAQNLSDLGPDCPLLIEQVETPILQDNLAMSYVLERLRLTVSGLETSPADVFDVQPIRLGAVLSRDQFILIGVMVLSLVSAGINSTASAVASYKERHVFRSVQRLSISVIDYCLAVILARGALVFVSIYGFWLLAIYLFNIPSAQSYFSVISLGIGAVLGIFLFSCLGLVIGIFVHDINLVTLISNTIYLPLLFFGNLTFPIGATDGVIGTVLAFNPASVLADGLRTSVLGGVVPDDLGRSLLLWLLLSLFCLALIIMFNKRLRN